MAWKVCENCGKLHNNKGPLCDNCLSYQSATTHEVPCSFCGGKGCDDYGRPCYHCNGTGKKSTL